jgi:hypothetical protein
MITSHHDAVLRKLFFSEEKHQKTFANSGVCAAGKVRDSVRKSLLLLFFRKEDLACFLAPPGSAQDQPQSRFV